ncbi:MAG: linear amide C-N hydrolase, partial [Christensenellales bacterium]
MCTAVTYKTKDFYFGRTLDYEFSYGDEVAITPRNYRFEFRFAGKLQSHYAMIGMAHVVDGFPLYYDAVNEKGLCIAGLNFVGNAKYGEAKDGKINVAQFEFIPWLLAQCASVREARELLQRVNVTNTPFSDKLPVASLHWIIADESEAITVECTEKGMFVYDNPIGVLTNNPPFDVQMFNLSNYMGLSPMPAENRFCPDVPLNAYSRGMGAIGLP